MHQIKCPHCGKEFTIDEASYADILNQVRTKEFNDEIHEKLKQLKKQHQSELELIEEKANNALEKKVAEKEKKIAELGSKMQALESNKKLELIESSTIKEKEIADLKAKLQLREKEAELEKILSKRNMRSKSNKKMKPLLFIKILKQNNQLR